MDRLLSSIAAKDKSLVYVRRVASLASPYLLPLFSPRTLSSPPLLPQHPVFTPSSPPAPYLLPLFSPRALSSPPLLPPRPIFSPSSPPAPLLLPPFQLWELFLKTSRADFKLLQQRLEAALLEVQAVKSQLILDMPALNVSFSTLSDSSLPSPANASSAPSRDTSFAPPPHSTAPYSRSFSNNQLNPHGSTSSAEHTNLRPPFTPKPTTSESALLPVTISSFSSAAHPSSLGSSSSSLQLGTPSGGGGGGPGIKEPGQFASARMLSKWGGAGGESAVEKELQRKEMMRRALIEENNELKDRLEEREKRERQALRKAEVMKQDADATRSQLQAMQQRLEEEEAQRQTLLRELQALRTQVQGEEGLQGSDQSSERASREREEERAKRKEKKEKKEKKSKEEKKEKKKSKEKKAKESSKEGVIDGEEETQQQEAQQQQQQQEQQEQQEPDFMSASYHSSDALSIYTPLSSLEIVSATNLPVLFVCNSTSTRGVASAGMGEKQGIAAAHAAREGIGVRWAVVREKLGRLQQERKGEGQEEEKVRQEEGKVELGEVDRRRIPSKGDVAAMDMVRVREVGSAERESKGRVEGVGRGQELGTEGAGIEGAGREGAAGAEAAERISSAHNPTKWLISRVMTRHKSHKYLWEKFLKSTRADFAGLQRHVVDVGVQMERLREENQMLREALQQQQQQVRDRDGQSAQVLEVWGGVGEEEAQGREAVQRELVDDGSELKTPQASEALRASVSSEALRASVSSEALRASASSEALRASASSEALRASASSEALRASASSEALRASEASGAPQEALPEGNSEPNASEALEALDAAGVPQRSLVEENRELRERVEERERAVRAAQSSADTLASELAAAQSQLSAAQQQAQEEREEQQRLAGELKSMRALLLQQMQAVAEQKELIERLLERQQQQAEVLESGGSGTVGPRALGSEPVGKGAVGSGAGVLGAGELRAGESGAGELGAGESGERESGAGESGAEESGTEESGTGESRAGESRAEESGAGKSGVAESGAGKLAAGELGAGELGALESRAGSSGAGGSEVAGSEVVDSQMGGSEAVGLATEMAESKATGVLKRVVQTAAKGE
ncbi:unnamed protein product [Closterium sp. Yama58-4]|nr:unnamed protein product [Closterium sp. Yama58-4]